MMVPRELDSYTLHGQCTVISLCLGKELFSLLSLKSEIQKIYLCNSNNLLQTRN